jgi:hypothetical protein
MTGCHPTWFPGAEMMYATMADAVRSLQLRIVYARHRDALRRRQSIVQRPLPGNTIRKLTPRLHTSPEWWIKTARATSVACTAVRPSTVELARAVAATPDPITAARQVRS